MDIRGITEQQLYQALDAVNMDYKGNLRVDEVRWASKKILRLRLKTNGTKGRGFRRHNIRNKAGARRKSGAACWHSFRDFFWAVFQINSAAVIKTGVIKYDGIMYFNASFEATGERNIGSQADPMLHRYACDCDTDEHTELEYAFVEQQKAEKAAEKLVRASRIKPFDILPALERLP